jgi:drug/metabolite transporter (DMT)-like permease
MGPPMRDDTPEVGAPSPWIVHGGLLAVQLGFASHYVVSKMVVRELPPSALALVRASGAALLMFVVHLALRGVPRVSKKDALALAGCAVLGIAGNQLLFFHGLARTTASNASVLITTIPVFTFIVSVALRRETVTARALGGIALALSGVLVLLGAEALSLGSETIVGDVMIVLNCLFYGSYLVLVGGLVKRLGSMTAVVWLFFFGALWVAPFGAGDLVRHAGDVAPGTWVKVLYIIFVPTIFTYLVNAWALRHAPASLVAIYIYLQPIAATALAVAFLGEEITPRLMAAAALVFVGIGLLTFRRKAAPITSAPPVDR